MDTKLKNLGLNVLKPLRYAEQRRTLSNMDRNLYARMDGTKWTDKASGVYKSTRALLRRERVPGAV